LEALIEQIKAIARESPVLLIFEDAHWADPSSLEVLGRLVDEIDTLRVLLFVTFRPEFAAPWVGRSHVGDALWPRQPSSDSRPRGAGSMGPWLSREGGGGKLSRRSAMRERSVLRAR
jgi:hypothetical protein